MDTAPEQHPLARAGISTALAGARLSAAFGPCRHEETEPVELVVTGEVVAQVCTACLAGLPAEWDGTLTEVHAWGSREPVRVIPHG